MLLELEAVSAGYGRIVVLERLTFGLPAGALVTMLGPNGAGKTTIARAITGLVHVSAGTVRFDGSDITRLQAERRVRLGISLVPQGRELFPAMSVRENLELGAFSRWSRTDRRDEMDRVFAVFPRLAERAHQLAGTLSGGEQQMLAIGRALMSRPRLLVLDEPSLGLAPLLVEEILRTIQRINAAGTTVLLIEQNARLALEISDRGFVVESGAIRLAGSVIELQTNPEVQETYLGIRGADHV